MIDGEVVLNDPIMVKDPHSPGHQGAEREDKARARPAAAAIAAIAAIVLSFLAAACFRPGLFEERPEREQTPWRPLRAEEKKALRRRLADEPIIVRGEDVDAVRIPDEELPWLEWSKPRRFRGAAVHCEFRVIRFRPSAGADDWPLSFTLVRDPVVDSEGLVWAGAGTGRGAALESVGAVRYRFDLLIPEVRETRHCLFYERQLDRRERRHLLYAEELIRKLQNDGEDFVSRLLRADQPLIPAGAGSAASSDDRRAALLAREAARFADELPRLRDRYWTASQEEARTNRETIAVTESDRRDLFDHCLATPGATRGP